MEWLDNIKVSLYNYHGDNTGQPVTYREILLTKIGIPHWVWVPELKRKVKVTDIDTIIQLRALDRNAIDYDKKKTELKALLYAYAPAALLECKAAGCVKEIGRSGLMQIDFDHKTVKPYDIEELKAAVFSLRFIAFCGLSCSGDGFYALAAIAEPARLSDYAEHIFEVLKDYGVEPDESKGKKVQDLRFLSYDSNMLIREDPEPLKVHAFKRKEQAQKSPQISTAAMPAKGNKLIASQLELLNSATQGNRFKTVQRVAYTLGGIGDRSILEFVQNVITLNQVFAEGRSDFLKIAEKCSHDGSLKPLPK